MYRRVIRFRVLAVVATVAWCAGYAHAQTTVEVRVASGTDDAEEHLTEGNTIDLTSSDLELGAEGGGGDTQEIGIRFLNVDIPRNATIDSAFIQFTVDETDDEATSVRIFGELAPNPVTYAGNSGNITSRTKTSSFVDWNNIPLWSTVGLAGPDQQTPDLSPVVQQIISQPAWSPNNALAFIIAPNPGGERTAESFNGSAGQAALLTVVWSDVRVPGDVNEDGVTDGADFEIILQNMFMSVLNRSDGDLNFDGVVDFADFREWKDNKTGGAVASGAVPEPSGLILVTLAAAGVLGLRRRGRLNECPRN